MTCVDFDIVLNLRWLNWRFVQFQYVLDTFWCMMTMSSINCWIKVMLNVEGSLKVSVGSNSFVEKRIVESEGRKIQGCWIQGCWVKGCWIQGFVGSKVVEFVFYSKWASSPNKAGWLKKVCGLNEVRKTNESRWTKACRWTKQSRWT